jgi:peptide/nickel transport system substrate-binding protein
MDKDIENDLGVGVESPDAITWTVKLRPDAKFHNVAPVNGRLVEAEDIKATFTRAQDRANPNAGNLNMIDPDQVQTPDKTTVVFKLKYPYAPFRKTLASATYSWIFPREVLTGGYDPAKQVIGSGPFILESVTPDVAHMYRKNPEWFERGRPYAETLRAAIIPDAAQQLAQFTAGNLDELVLSSPQDVSTAKQNNPKATLLKVENASPNPLYLQLGDPTSPFQDVRVRRALSMAIDRDALGKVVYDGEAKAMVFVPSYMGKWALAVKDLPPDIQQYYKYNPGEAKKLLEAAGQSNLQLRFVFVVNSPTPGGLGSPTYMTLGETIANMLNSAGIKTTPVMHDYTKDYVAGGKGSRQGYFDKDMVVLAGAAPNTDADEFIFNHFDSRSTSNAERLNDPTLDAMIDKQRTIVNEDDRLKAILEIQRYLADKMYVVPTVGTYRWLLVQPRVRNYQYSDTLGKMTEIYAKLWLKG